MTFVSGRVCTARLVARLARDDKGFRGRRLVDVAVVVGRAARSFAVTPDHHDAAVAALVAVAVTNLPNQCTVAFVLVPAAIPLDLLAKLHVEELGVVDELPALRSP
ncbi:hypothetical protein [Calidifontibacter indicus]|uniref:hypothetical protein n=1 Tax=Calidifontibacter indicus TaxID=419650 RepID=UPI003D70C1FF